MCASVVDIKPIYIIKCCKRKQGNSIVQSKRAKQAKRDRGQADASLSILVAYYSVFIIKPVIRTGIVCTVEKSVHLVFIKIYHAYIAFIIVIIDIIGTGLTVCSFFLIHSFSLFPGLFLFLALFLF